MCFLQALQPDPEEADHAEGAGQGPHFSGDRCQTAGTRQKGFSFFTKTYL